MRELRPDVWKMSLRTGPRINATEACRLLGGGGHAQAAGCEILGSQENARMALLAEVGRRTWNNDDSNSLTVHSAVYNLTDKTVLWVGNEHYGEDGHTFRYSLQK